MGDQFGTKTIALRGGGSVTLTAQLDLFSMSESDRTFVLSLIDQLSEYEAETTEETEPSVENEEPVES